MIIFLHYLKTVEEEIVTKSISHWLSHWHCTESFSQSAPWVVSFEFDHLGNSGHISTAPILGAKMKKKIIYLPFWLPF